MDPWGALSDVLTDTIYDVGDVAHQQISPYENGSLTYNANAQGQVNVGGASFSSGLLLLLVLGFLLFKAL